MPLEDYCCCIRPEAKYNVVCVEDDAESLMYENLISVRILTEYSFKHECFVVTKNI